MPPDVRLAHDINRKGDVKKLGLSYEKHQDTGSTLREMRNAMLELSVELKNAYPRESRLGKLSGEVVDALDTLRIALNQKASEDYPEEHAAGPSKDLYV